MQKLCDRCKKAGRVFCPHNTALEAQKRMKGMLKQDMFGPTPPNLMVGHSFYPNVYWGPLVCMKDTKDDPNSMYGMSAEEIIELRASVVRGMKKANVKQKTRMLEDAQAAVMSIRPVDIETRFSKKPSFGLKTDRVTSPVGASAPIEKLRLAENPAVPKKVDEFYNENVLASEALQELLLSGFDVHYLSKLLCSGILGKKQSKKLVPTKWAITATDDIAAKHLMESIRYCRQVDQPLIFSNTYLDNHFEVLLLPGNWEYEQFEALVTKELEQKRARDAVYSFAPWEEWVYDGRINVSIEHEGFEGRADYAKSQGGGYYAARFAVCEELYRMKRQARAIVFREIGTSYTVSVGVWEVRENVRHAFANQPEKLQTMDEALAHLAKKLAVPVNVYRKKSEVLSQTRLTGF